MKKKCTEKLVYYLSWLAAVVVAVLILFEVNAVFDIFEIMGGFILYVIYYAAALLLPLVLLSSLLAFRIGNTAYGKKSIKLLVNVGIVYAVVKIILVIISSFNVFNSGVF